MKVGILIALGLLVGGCANTARYQPSDGYYGGYTDQKISDSSFKINFSGNNTDLLTIQTYWLYRASELTLEKGFDGFEILDPAPTDKPAGNTSYRVRCPDLNLVCSQHHRTPWMDAFATIRLIKGTIKAVPFRVFDARALKISLDPIVKGKSCGDPGLMLGTAKVCPHDKGYLVQK